MNGPGFTISAPLPDDRTHWEALYRGYAEHYQRPVSTRTLDTVWHWLMDPEGPIEGLLARETSGRAVALLHFRPMPSPLRGAMAGFADDLFVAPEYRGQGAAEALFASLGEDAARRGWTFVRWITRADNHRARAMYRRVARETDWVTCEMDVERPGG